MKYTGNTEFTGIFRCWLCLVLFLSRSVLVLFHVLCHVLVWGCLVVRLPCLKMFSCGCLVLSCLVLRLSWGVVFFSCGVPVLSCLVLSCLVLRLSWGVALSCMFCLVLPCRVVLSCLGFIPSEAIQIHFLSFVFVAPHHAFVWFQVGLHPPPPSFAHTRLNVTVGYKVKPRVGGGR
jgi:hypothetical protein